MLGPQVGEMSREASSSHFYVDGHRKAVYTETLIPRGLIGRLSKIAGCRALVLLHDEQGPPLLAPLTVDHQGTVLREAAPAQFWLARPDRQDEPLLLSVAWIRDLRKSVVCPPSEEELPGAWWADIRHEEVAWWQAGWQATAAPALPTEPKLIPIVTTAEQIDAVTLAQTYIHRWPAQENVIKDFLLPLGLDTNHGFAKTPVINSEVNKKREALEKRCANVERWREAAREKAHRASVLGTKLWKQTKEHGEGLYRALNERLQVLEAQEVAEGTYRVERRKLK